MNTQGSGLLHELYSVNKLVCINSAHHGYSEIPLDHHMVLYGGNNKGKTVTLNMMKLILFPDTSFKGCRTKFAFQSKDGSYYDTAISHSYYFPSDKSYIILEGENPEGIYCMILYRMKEWGYGRIFVAATYDEIRSLWWDEEQRQLAENLSLTHLLAGLKTFTTLQINDDTELAQVMFAGYRSSKPKSRRFCVFPLSGDASTETISAFRRVYQLAFDTSNNKDTTLPMAIATLIEMNRSRPQERLNANLLSMAEEHSQLVEKGNWLQRLQNCLSNWLQVEQRYTALESDFVSYSSDFFALEKAVLELLTHSSSKLEQAKKDHDDHANRLNGIKEAHKSLSDSSKTKQSEIATLKRLIEDFKARHRKGREIVAEYAGNFDNDEVASILQEDIEELKTKLEAYKNKESMEERFALITRQLKQLKTDRDLLQQQLTQEKTSVADQLSDESKAIIHSLNSELASAGVTLSEAAVSDFETFASYFDASAGKALILEGQLLKHIPIKPFNAAAYRQKLELDLQRSDDKIIDMEKEQIDIRQQLADGSVQDSLAQIEKELKRYEASLKLVKGIDVYLTEIEKNEAEVSAFEQEYAGIKERLISQARMLEEYQRLYHEARNQHDAINREHQKAQQVEKQLASLRVRLEPQMTVNIQPRHSTTISNDAVEQLESAANKIVRGLSELSGHFSQLINEVAHPEIERFTHRQDLRSYQDDMSKLAHTFATFEHDHKKHIQEIRTHNQYVNNQLRELHDAKAQISNMKQLINQDLNSRKISNLSEVALDIKLRPSFTSLLDKLESHNIEDSTLPEISFYEEVRKFAETHFNKRSGQLKLADIIERVDYVYQLDDSNERVTEGQSGGTTSAITAFVLSVLLKQIVHKNYLMRLPIVVDEIGTLDSKNTRAVVEQIIEHGFTLFCATPNYSPTLDRIVGRTLNMDAAVLEKVRVPDCSIHVTAKHINYFGARHEA